MATPDRHDECACGTRMANSPPDWRVKVRSGNVKEPHDCLLLRAPLLLAQKPSTGRVAANVMDVSVKSMMKIFFRLLRHESDANERTVCVTLVREAPSRPDRSKPLLNLRCLSTRSVHAHLSHVLDLHLLASSLVGNDAPVTSSYYP